jgi:N-acetylglutamate synthase-like GNAT family acetyltransferase
MEIKLCDINNFNELKEIFDLLKQVWFLDNFDQFKDNIKDFIQLNKREIYIIKDDNKILGTTTLHYQPKLIRNGCIAGLIEEVVVDENSRGKKIGEKLVKYVTKKAIENGCYKVILSCFPERIGFYERCGFINESHTMRFNIK